MRAAYPEDRPEDSMPLADGAREPAEERTATIYWLILTVLFVGAIVLRPLSLRRQRSPPRHLGIHQHDASTGRWEPLSRPFLQ